MLGKIQREEVARTAYFRQPTVFACMLQMFALFEKNYFLSSYYSIYIRRYVPLFMDELPFCLKIKMD